MLPTEGPASGGPFSLRAILRRREPAAPHRARLDRRRVRADRAQARGRDRHEQPRPALRGGALRHRPDRGAADLRRRRRRRSARPIPATPTATARPSTSPRSPRRRSWSWLSLAIAWRALWRLFGLASGQVDPRWYAIVVIGVVMVVDADARRPSRTAPGARYRKPGAAGERAPLRKRLRRLDGGAARPLAARAGLPLGRLGCGALRRRARAGRGGAADARQHRRPDGPRPARRAGGRAGGDRGARAAGRAAAAAHAPGGRAAVRRRRHRRPAGRGGRPGPRRRRRGRGRGPPRAAATATSSSTSSRSRTRRRCASACSPPRSGSRACARSTTSASCASAVRPRSRCTSSSRASCRSRTRTRSPPRSSARSSSRCRRWTPCRRTSSRSPRPRRAESVDEAAPTATSSSGSCGRQTGQAPRELRFLRTDDGLLAYLTLGLDPRHLAGRRARARERDRGAHPPRAARDRRRDRAHGAVEP